MCGDKRPLATLVVSALVSLAPAGLSCRAEGQATPPRTVAIIWDKPVADGRIQIANGRLDGLRIANGQGQVRPPDQFASVVEPFRVEFTVRGATPAEYAKGRPLVTVRTRNDGFSFFLADVDSRYPIYLPQFAVIVTHADDRRSYGEIQRVITSRGLQTTLQRIEAEPEETFENAALHTKAVENQTWLGVSRDIRIFAISERLDWIQPRFAGYLTIEGERPENPSPYSFSMGRGWGPIERIERRLEEAVLPILRGVVVDDDIRYELTAFVGLESQPLTAANLRGTHFLVADRYGAGHVFTKEQQDRYEAVKDNELNQPEETVLYLRMVALNTASVPRYAFLRNPTPPVSERWSWDSARGLGLSATGQVFCVSTLNGKPLLSSEVSINLKPGESATLEARLPHRPIPAQRVAALATPDFSARLDECRAFWKQKLASAARISLPEPRLNDMIQAGLLQMDLIIYGLEPDGPLSPAIGIYAPIGIYGDPTLHFMDSMGWHSVVKRCLDYFLEKQHEDGFFQNFAGYMAETGAVLANLGDHYRYTRDDAWVRQIAPRVVKSCEFLRNWRERNKREELRGRGYGLLEGKTADPEDPFHSFMLNGYAYLGLIRAAEMLAGVDPAESRRWREEAEMFKKDIRSALEQNTAESPVIPLGDGTWCRTAAPWADSRGPVALHFDGGPVFSHQTMMTRDSLLGPLYLVVTEVIDPSEPLATELLHFHNELMTTRNVAFSQPYLSRHSIVHIERGEVKPFLKSVYNLVAGIADRDTYTFREHYFGASPHSVDGLNWFLMDLRSMLFLEQGDTLKLLPGIPRSYLEPGKRIEMERVESYFGPFSMSVDSKLNEGRILATLRFLSDRRPGTLLIRLPHPLRVKACKVEGGVYRPELESIEVQPGTAKEIRVAEVFE